MWATTDVGGVGFDWRWGLVNMGGVGEGRWWLIWVWWLCVSQQNGRDLLQATEKALRDSGGDTDSVYNKNLRGRDNNRGSIIVEPGRWLVFGNPPKRGNREKEEEENGNPP